MSKPNSFGIPWGIHDNLRHLCSSLIFKASIADLENDEPRIYFSALQMTRIAVYSASQMIYREKESKSSLKC